MPGSNRRADRGREQLSTVPPDASQLIKASESFLALESVAQQENMPRRPQTAIDREDILGHQIRPEPPTGPEIREKVRRVLARASVRFGQAEIRQSPAEEIGIETEIDRVRLPDDQRRRADERPAPDVCLQSHVCGQEALALSPVLDRIPGRVLAALLVDVREAEGEVRAQDGRSPQNESR